MARELQRGLVLAGVGLLGGFALVAVVFGTGELLKRSGAITSDGSAPPSSLPSSLPLAAPGAGLPGGASGPPPTASSDAGTDPAAKAVAGDAARGAPTLGTGEAARPAGDAPVAADGAPTFDIVRVEPNGDTVIAGRGRPNAVIEVLRDDRTVARTTADAAGQFAIVPPPLPSGSSEITLRALGPDGTSVRARESVAVVVAAARDTKPLIALSSPDRPTVVLSQPDAAAPGERVAGLPAGAAGEPASPSEAGRPGARPGAPLVAGGAKAVEIVSVDAQEGGRLFVTARAAPGAALRLYLNDTLVASGRSGADGRIAFTIGRGVDPGAYQVRVDQVETGTGRVRRRSEVAFAVPPEAGAKGAGAPATAVAPKGTEPARGAAGTRTAGGPVGPARSLQAHGAPSPPVAGPAPLGAMADRGAGAPAAAAKPGRPGSPAAPAGASAGARADGAPAVDANPSAAGPSASSPGAASLSAATSGAATPGAAVPGAAPGMAAVRAGRPSRSGAPATATAGPPTASAHGEAPRAEAEGSVYVAEIGTARITRGDSLWQISRRAYGKGNRYTVIYDANQGQIRDPDVIYPGQIFVLPKDLPTKETPAAAGRG